MQIQLLIMKELNDSLTLLSGHEALNILSSFYQNEMRFPFIGYLNTEFEEISSQNIQFINFLNNLNILHHHPLIVLKDFGALILIGSSC